MLYAILSAESAAARMGVSRTEGLGLVALTLPVLVAFTMADAALGSLAASRKLSTRGLDLVHLIGAKAAAGAATSFVSLDVAREHPDSAAKYGAAPGALVKLQGFVLRPAGGPGGSFTLARMSITCCVADSIALSARVLPPEGAPVFGQDTWLEVDGAVEGRGPGLCIRAARITEIPNPRQPYESFAG